MFATLFYDTLATVVTLGRRTSAVFAVLLLSSGSGFSVVSTGRQDVTWSHDLGLPKLSDINARLNVAEITPAGEPLRMSRGIGGQSEDRIVRTCQEYLNSVSAHFVTASTFDARQEIQFVHDCYVLRDLKGVQPAKQTFLPGWSYEILSVAPPLLQFGEYRDFDPQIGWAATEPRLHGTSITSQSISAEDDTANYELQLVATGDFNRDGVADLAIVGEVRAKEGSYIRGDYYVLTRCRPRGLLVQVSRSNQPFLLDQSRCD